MSKPFTARDVADLVIEKLRPLLQQIEKRMPAEGELRSIVALGKRVERLESKIRKLEAT